MKVVEKRERESKKNPTGVGPFVYGGLGVCVGFLEFLGVVVIDDFGTRRMVSPLRWN